MKVLDELEREITRVAHTEGPARRWRWLRSTPVLVLAPLSAAAVAVAAGTGLLTGEPVRNPSGYKPNPKLGVGVPEQGRAQLLGVRAADPDGGPPWGLQVARTSRGYLCVQLGRVVDGRLGELGRDGNFHDDGKFHPLGPEVVERANCTQPDARGFAFIAINYRGVPASASGAACAARRYRFPPGLPSRDRRPICPRGSMRVAMYGLLGPEGEAVTYKAPDGTTRRVRAAGTEGAYLVVLPEPTPRPRNFGYWSPSQTPGSGLSSVQYRDGTTCSIPNARRHGGARRCPAKGYTQPATVKLSRSALATPIRLVVSPRTFVPHVPKGAPAGLVARQRNVRISFRAPVRGTARRYYTIEARLSGGRGCRSAVLSPIARDIAAGSTVVQRQVVPARCHGRLAVRVGYAQPTTPTDMPFVWRPKDITPVGSASVDLP